MGGRDSQHRKEICRNGHAAHLLRIAKSGEGEVFLIDVHETHLLQGLSRIAIIRKIGLGDGNLPESLARDGLPQHYDAARVAVRQRTQKNSVNDGEDYGICADSQSKDYDDESGKPRILA